MKNHANHSSNHFAGEGVSRWHRRLAQSFQGQFIVCVAFGMLLVAAVSSFIVARAAPAGGDSPQDVRVPGGNHGIPKLWFACDGPTSELDALFSQPGVIDDLKDLNAGIVLDAPDLTADRAQLVLKLNHTGVPVTAWLALPRDQGYYFNSSNAPAAAAHFADFQKWTAANGLQWNAVGLDVEPTLQEFAALKQKSKWRLAAKLVGRYFDTARVRRAKIAYSTLIREIRSSGYFVETYQFPFIADERAAHSTLLERLTGIVDLKSDQEVLMIYTSFNHSLDSAMIWAYGRDAQAIAVGSTSGSDSDSQFVPLNWDEFSRDLIVASHFSRVIGVYNLQGCAQQGFLPRLKTLNWNETVTIPAGSIRKATQLRARIQRILWIGSHLPYFVAALLILLVWAISIWHRRRRPVRVS